MAWLPNIMGANRENHLMRSSSVIRSVSYGKGSVVYEAFDAPAPSTDVLRLAFRPTSVIADGKSFERYTADRLPAGDWLVTIRRDGLRKIEIRGEDPQTFLASGSAMNWTFTGNQVRVIGGTGERGGKAEVFLDGVKQIVEIDFYTPAPMRQQVLYYRNGLANGTHTLKIGPAARHNPLSGGNETVVDGIQFSSATGDGGFGEGGGPTEAQRFLFGYTGRKDYVDADGNLWRPGTEFVVRTGRAVDPVARSWWVMPRQEPRLISGTPDPQLYLYGIHAPELVINVTAGPGVYHARLKFAETEFTEAGRRGITILINGEKKVSDLDLFATGGAKNKAVDLVFNTLRPKNGIIEVRLSASSLHGCRPDAILQALEVGPGEGGTGARALPAR
jgi:Di-glucose binding within endoplasmic reticulum.